QRAKSVLSFLVAQKIDEQRLSYSGKGATEPIEDNSTDEGRMKNRRIEFVVQ
ncbi:MAG: OmpA family protein, partial [Paludibacteraceae bacterium]|nr:OmpA family protein [Paludibacteraceae bacterium]